MNHSAAQLIAAHALAWPRISRGCAARSRSRGLGSGSSRSTWSTTTCSSPTRDIGRRSPDRRPPAARPARRPRPIYPRLRAGVRATIALLVGLHGVLGGVEAVYYAAESGRRVTTTRASSRCRARSCCSASASLRSGVAPPRRRAVVALRPPAAARGRDGDRRVLRRAAGRALVRRHARRRGARAGGRPRRGARERRVQESDGLRLKGWYVPSRNGAAVIAFAGRRDTQLRARMLVRHGYGVLLFDRRGEGESEGDPNLFGWQGERDVHGAVAFLQQRPTWIRSASARSGCPSAARC